MFSALLPLIVALARLAPDVWAVVSEDNKAADTKEALISGLAARHKDIVIRALQARHDTSDLDEENDRSKR